MFSRPRQIVLVVITLAILFAAIACGTSSNAPAANTPPAASTVEAAAQSDESAVDVNHPYDEQADPKADIAAAMQTAQSDSKYVLLDFGANWCPDCIVLATLFEDASVKPYLDANFHVVHIDVGYWDKNLDVSEQYGNPIEKGIPAVVVVTSDGEMVATTKAGELANARTATTDDVLAYLHQWAPTQ